MMPTHAPRSRVASVGQADGKGHPVEVRLGRVLCALIYFSSDSRKKNRKVGNTKVFRSNIVFESGRTLISEPPN